MDWKPIKTAPKGSGRYPLSGSPILLLTNGDSIYMGFWNGISWDDGDFHNNMGDMTHWMPLPGLPEQGAANGS